MPQAMPNALQRGCAWLIVGIFAGTGPLVLLLGLISAVRTGIFLATSLATDGDVIDLQPVRGSRGGYSYAPVFRFTADDGQIYIVTSKTSTRPAAFGRGERVKVLFDKGHPESAKIATFLQLWMFPMVAGVVGGAFSLITFAVLRRKRKAAAAAA